MAEIGVVVKAGHFFDPPECQGLAHLLEHVLFLGSRHHPQPNQVLTELEQLDASLTAATSFETTQFFLTSPLENLTKALLLLTDLLTSPLFLPDRIEREITTIDEEFRANINDPARRFHDVRRALFNPAHPITQFSVGNRDTFAPHDLQSIQSMLMQFHRQYYTATNMSLCIRMPLPHTQQREALAHFCASLPRGEEVTYAWPALFLPTQHQKLVQIQRAQSPPHLSLHLSMELPATSSLQSCVDILIMWLGDESRNTLIDGLAALQLCSNVTVGRGIELTEYTELVITMTLTAQGRSNIATILRAFYDYIAIIEAGCHELWRYQETTMLLSAHDVSMDVIEVARDLVLGHSTTPENSLVTNADYPIMMRELLSKVRSAAVQLFLSEKQVTTNDLSPFYKVPYWINDNHLIFSMLEDSPPAYAFKLPPANPYIGALVKSKSTTFDEPFEHIPLPRRVTENGTPRVWLATVEQPTETSGDIYLSIEHPSLVASSTHVAVKKLALMIITETAHRRFFNASLAGLKQRFYGHQAGFSVHASGAVNMLIPFFLEQLDHLHHCEFTLETFVNAKQRLLSQCHNHLFAKPINRLFTQLTHRLQPRVYTPLQLHQALSALTFNQFNSLWHGFPSQAFGECLLHGNWSVTHAQHFSRQLERTLRLRGERPLIRHALKSHTSTTEFIGESCETTDAAVVIYIQPNTNTPEMKLFCMLVEQLLATPFFDELRTSKQAGYVVGSGYTEHSRYPGITFYAQSAHRSTLWLFNEIVKSLSRLLGGIKKHRQDWTKIKSTLARQLSPEHWPQRVRAQQLWANIDLSDAPQAPHERLLTTLSGYSFDDMMRTTQQLLNKHAFSFVVLYTTSHEIDTNCLNNSTLVFS